MQLFTYGDCLPRLLTATRDVCLHVDTETNPAQMCRRLIQAPESSVFTAICNISRIVTAWRRAKPMHLPLRRVFFHLRSRHLACLNSQNASFVKSFVTADSVFTCAGVQQLERTRIQRQFLPDQDPCVSLEVRRPVTWLTVERLPAVQLHVAALDSGTGT